MKYRISAAIIFLFAFVLRVIAIDKVPPSLYWDEAAIGYNAYSILKTGADEHGNRFPIFIRSFDDYKLSGMVYAVVPSIALFGLNERGVRFPSALFGAAAVIIFYFLLQTLFRNETLSIAGSILLAISPWHLQFSRAAFEANGGFCIFMLFITFLCRRNHRLAVIASAISMYFYSAYWFIVPFVWLFWFFQNRNDIRLNKHFAMNMFLFVFLISPLAVSVMQSGYKRPFQVFLGNQESIMSSFNESRARNNNNFISKVYYNKNIFVFRNFAENYFSHFSPQFLFFQGDTNERHKTLGMGLFYIWEIPMLYVGLRGLRHWKDKRKNVCIAILLLAPVPASLSYPAPHALRALPLLLPLLILNSIGVNSMIQRLGKASVIIVPVIIFFFVEYVVLYYDHAPRFTSRSWGYGYKESFAEMNKFAHDYDKIFFTGHYWKPYIYYLFYYRVDPFLFQKNHNEKKIGTIEFTGTSWANNEVELDKVDLVAESKRQKTLFVLSDREYVFQKQNNWLQKENEQPNVNVMKIIKDLQGLEMFYIIEIR